MNASTAASLGRCASLPITSYRQRQLDMTKTLLLILFLIFSVKTFSQTSSSDSLRPYAAALKININGRRVGVEQKIFKRITIQLEGLLNHFFYLTSYLTVNPQLRYYPKLFKRQLSYFGIGYFCIHQSYSMSDSVRLNGTTTGYLKTFDISKYIHAITLNYGFIATEKYFPHILNLILD
jgi:hypothetical protein